ncbi:MAG: hypothetical protein AB7S74_10875 [Hyphomicrobium sp.]
MNKIPLAAIAVSIATLATPALAAKPDCYGGYKSFLGKVNPYIGHIEDVDLPTLMRRGLSVYDACLAGDNFVPEGAWNQVIFDMEKAAKKK